MLQLNIHCSWWWAYAPETCRAKDISVNYFVAWSWHFTLCKLYLYVPKRSGFRYFNIWFYFSSEVTYLPHSKIRMPVLACYHWTCSVQIWTEQCTVSSPPQTALLFRKHFRCKEICLENQWIVCLVISTNETRKTNKQVGCCIHMVIQRSYTWDRMQFPAAC